MGRDFANGPGDLGSIPGQFIAKTLKMVLDISLLNIQQYKVLGVLAIKKGVSVSPLNTVANFTYLLNCGRGAHNPFPDV